MLAASGCDQGSDDGINGAAVATAHPLATGVGVDILRAGGNAADAAVAVSFALAVVEPYSSGLGGGGFLVVHQADTGEQLTLDARETAPAAATEDMYLHNGEVVDGMRYTGALSVAVPSLVRGLEAFHGRCGHLPWADLVTPAVRLATDGFPVDSRMHERIGHHRDRFDPAAKDVFMPDGEPAPVGHMLRQLDLAVTLSAIRDQGAAGFYEGDVAAKIVKAVQDAGGLLTQDDLTSYRPRWLHATAQFRRHTPGPDAEHVARCRTERASAGEPPARPPAGRNHEVRLRRPQSLAG